MVLTLDANDHIVSIRGDPQAPLSSGYACFKGLQAEEAHHGPARILRPRKRRDDGSYIEIDSETALGEISERLGKIVDRHGPSALAIYVGNGALFNATSFHLANSFLAAFGSDQYFSSVTLDQSSKMISRGRLGSWAAGFHELDQADVLLCFGVNPLVSHAMSGLLVNDPVRKLKQARANGLKLIIVDPRLTETARNADLVLRPHPGQDAIIAGAMIRMILAEEWEDKAFCSRYVGTEQLAALRTAVAPLTPEYAEARAGLEPCDIRRVTELFARDGRIGRATSATGISMMPGSDLAQHMIDVLNVLCGRFVRAGEPVRRVSYSPSAPVHAEVIPPDRGWEIGGPSRIRGARLLYGERPSGTLSDEIIAPGEDQIRALFIDGGDPISSFPDPEKMSHAFDIIDLLVSIEPWPVPTTHRAHYVLPPLMQYERSDLPMHFAGRAQWPGGWCQYTPPVLRPPVGSDLVDGWYVLWSIASRLGRQLIFRGTPLPTDKPPTTDDLLSLILKGSPFSLEELKRHPHGMTISLEGVTVQPERPGSCGCFEPMPPDVAADLAAFIVRKHSARNQVREGETPIYLLSVRRMRDMFCSNGRYVRTVRRRTPYNPLYMHPDDLLKAGLKSGDRVEVRSSHGCVTAFVDEDASLKPGVVTLAHGWGNLPGSDENVAISGSSVNALIDTDKHYEPFNAMPHMSALPVTVKKLTTASSNEKAHLDG